MALFVKPRYSAGDPDSIKYLASVGLSYEELSTATLKKARVMALDSTSEVTLDIDSTEYSNVPVWIHTDIGARNAMIAETEAAAAVDYFQDAALIFQFAGDSESSYPYALAMVKETVEDEEVVIEPIAVIGALQGTDIGDETNLSVTDDIASVVKAIADKQDTAYETYRPYFLFKFTADGDTSDVRYVSFFSIADGDFLGVNAVAEYSIISGSDYKNIMSVIGTSLLVENRTTSSFVAHIPDDSELPNPDTMRFLSSYAGISSGTTSFYNSEDDKTETIEVRIISESGQDVRLIDGYSFGVSPYDTPQYVYQLMEVFSNAIIDYEIGSFLGGSVFLAAYEYVYTTSGSKISLIANSSYSGEEYSIVGGNYIETRLTNCQITSMSPPICVYDYEYSEYAFYVNGGLRISNPINLLTYDVYTEIMFLLGFKVSYVREGTYQTSTDILQDLGVVATSTSYVCNPVCEFGNSEFVRHNIFNYTLSDAVDSISSYFSNIYTDEPATDFQGTGLSEEQQLDLSMTVSLYLVPFSATQNI